MSIWTRFTSRFRAAGAWLAHRFPEHVRDEWPNVLFVPALFLVMDSFVLWLDAVDSYAFLLISNYGVVSTNIPQPGKAGGAVVVLIDNETHERRYLERSPLDRCRLLADLRTIYAAHPHRLAIDIDISPALLLEPEITESERTTFTCERATPDPSTERGKEFQCQQHLYELILDSARQGIQTVLMSPIEVGDPAYRNRQRCWQDAMEKERNVRFARADLPVDYGLVIKQYNDDGSFAGVVHKLGEASAFHSQERNDALAPGAERRARIRINPKYYVSGLYPVPIGLPSTADPPFQSATADVQSIKCNAHDWLDATKPFDVRLRCALNKAVDSSNQEHKVVFFGAAYGADDTFLTPLGDLYGVEIQAAAYLSRVDPVYEANNKRLAFIGDVVMALTFGFVFASLWTAFYQRRLSDKAADRVRAPMYVVMLGAAFLLLVGFFCWLSVWLLSKHGVWLSPLPIAVGMLIDCFISGSVQQGVRAASRGTRPEAKGLSESFRRFFWYDWHRLYHGGNRVAARWLAARRFLWAAIIVWALTLLAFGTDH